MRNFLLLLKIRLDESLSLSRMRYSDNRGERTEGTVYMFVKLALVACMYALVQAVCVYIGRQGLAGILPTMAYILAVVLSFLMTVVNMNELITGNEDSEFLLSTPMSEFNHVFLMFLTLYLKSFKWVVLLCVPAVIVYAAYTPLSAAFWICWVLGLLLTAMPLGGLGALMGMGITLTLAENPKKEQIQSGISLFLFLICVVIILSLIDRVGMVMLRGIESTPEVLSQNITQVLIKNFFFGRFYYHAVIELNGAYIFLFVLASALWYVTIAMLVGMSYRIMTISLRCPVQYRVYEWKPQKQESVKTALMRREWQLFFKSRAYMVKSMSALLAGIIIPLNFLIISPGMFLRIFNLEHYTAAMRLAVPFIVCVFVGLGATSYCSFSIEGRRHWIIDTVPQDMRLIYGCKVRVNLCLAVPFSVLSGLLFALSFKADAITSAIYVLIPAVYSFMCAYWGVYTDVRVGSYLNESESQAMYHGASYLIGYLPGVIIPLICAAACFIK